MVDDPSREQRDAIRDREALGRRLTAEEEETCRVVEAQHPIAREEQEAWHALNTLLDDDDDDLSVEDASRLVEQSIVKAASLGPQSPDDIETHALGSSERAAETEPLGAGDRFERYTVLEQIGAGGMGVVYSAYDAQLDRKVALKLLKRRLSGSSATSNAPTRLLREAQAMARLSHPNVTQVYEADTSDGQTYIAFEYVQGKTLRAWLKDGPRKWSRVLPPFVAAGHGLHAAHAVGLVHRDFKPTNVLVADDGQVRVTDFGLARLEASESPSPSEGSQDGPVPTTSQSITTVGTVLGTPRYMAPEQLRGEEVDARADQFGFCVALWEALHGGHPYAERKDEDLTDAFARGKLRPTAKTDVPRWLHRALARGLAIDPAQRWPSMADLLLRLERSPRHMWGWVAAASLLVLGASAVYVVVHQRRSAAQICSGGDDKIAAIWNDERRASVQRAFHDTHVSLADDAWSRAAGRIDAYAGVWAETHRESCEATQIRQEQSEPAMDLRIACLGGQIQELDALLDVLAQPDEATVFRAIEMTTQLPPVERCSDIEALQARVAPPSDPDVARRVDELRGVTARARALHAAGRYKDGLELAVSTVERARALAYEPIVAEALVPAGMLHHGLGESDQAEQVLVEAALTAEANRQDRLAAEAKVRIVDVLSGQPERTDDAIHWSEQARAAIQRAGETDGPLEAHRLVELAGIYDTRAEPERALELAQRAVEIYERTGGPEDPRLSHALLTLGNASTWKDAERHYQRALEISEAVFGRDHPNVIAGIHNLALVLSDRGEYDEAQAYFERAISTWERVLGPEHPNVSIALANLGSMQAEIERFPEARRALERALAGFEKREGPDGVMVGHTIDSLGLVARGEGKLDEAHRLHARSLEILERVYGPEHPLLVPTLRARGESLVVDGKPVAALPFLERAYTLAASSQEGVDRPDAAFAIARALWDADRDRDRALQLADEARRLYVAHGPGAARRLAKTRAWLAERTGAR